MKQVHANLFLKNNDTTENCIFGNICVKDINGLKNICQRSILLKDARDI
jgi:hypothetical protein